MNRLQIQDHHIRRKGADYLAYTLIDTILDSHVITLKELEGELSKASEEIMDDPSTDNFRQIHTYRTELDKIRYYVLPLQQIMNSIELTESPLINQSTNTFLKNFQSHVAQVIDRIDTLSNRITEIRDIYNSSMNRRLDEIVRVLTME
jgi:magnesium transporter